MRSFTTPEIGLAGCDVTFRTCRQWTYVVFFAALSVLHFSIALPAFVSHRWEGYLSLIFAVIFAVLSGVCSKAGQEISIVRSERVVRLRTGLPKFYIERRIPFNNVHAVRLTLMDAEPATAAKHKSPPFAESRIELLCDNEDVECPPAPLPRQQALMMAIAMDVKLIRVGGSEARPSQTTPSAHKPGGRIWNM